MSLTVGIIGLPNVGKSTVLNALAQAGAEASNYPFCTIDCNRGVVAVPDPRLEKLEAIIRPQEKIYSHITFVDIAGLVEGASRGEGLGNKFLHHVREANVLAHVLRCFRDANVSHVRGDIDPLRDLETVETELFLSDLERVERLLEKEKHRSKAVKKGERRELDFLELLREKLSRGERITDQDLSLYARDRLAEIQLLTVKESIYILNLEEGSQAGEDELYLRVSQKLGGERTIAISAKIEEELAALPPEERTEFLREMGMEAGARERLIEKCHRLLGLIRYYTTANEKLQAWSVPAGIKAPQAAGKIHSDMEKGFIRAQVMSYGDLVEYGSAAEVQHQGHLRTEGHDYEIRDGDVIQYLFNR